MKIFQRVLQKGFLGFDFPEYEHMGEGAMRLFLQRNCRYPSHYFKGGNAPSLIHPQLVFGRNLFSDQLLNYYRYGLERNDMFLPFLAGYMKEPNPDPSKKGGKFIYRLVYQDFAVDVIHKQQSGITGAGKTSAIYADLFSLMWLNLPKWLKVSVFATKGFGFFRDVCNVHVSIPEIREGAKKLIERLHERMEVLNNSSGGSRHDVQLYNEHNPNKLLRYEVIIFDEFSNILRALEPYEQKQFEQEIASIASQGRSLGMHMVAMPQRPDVKGLPSSIKSQLPTSTTFRLKSMYDAKTADCEEAVTLKRGEAILDSLAGRGKLQMLHMPKNYPPFFVERIRKTMAVNGYAEAFK